MRELIQAVMKEMLDRKVMGIRQLLAAVMTVFAHQRSGAFQAVLRFFLMRLGRRCHWKRSFHLVRIVLFEVVQSALYSECRVVFGSINSTAGGATDPTHDLSP